MNSHQSETSRRGGTLVASLIVVVALTGVASAIFSVSFAHKKESGEISNELRAFYNAEAGITESVAQIAAAKRKVTAAPTSLGSRYSPRKMRRGSFFCDITDNGDTTFTVLSNGMLEDAERRLQVVVEPVDGSIYEHAIYAGNSSGDPSYEMSLGGTDASADLVTGDIYSGGSIAVSGDAELQGDAFAAGTITGTSGVEGASRPAPDLVQMDYATTADFNVASLFATATWRSDSLGGSAWEMPESSPVHIFRKNPSDRATEIGGTAKNDYFLEDPFEPAQDATGTHHLTLSGVNGEPGSSGNEKVYYIDGNLWVHNNPYGKLRISNPDYPGVRVVFVVKGNVYFSDDVLVGDRTRDAIAFIAMKDPAHADSGNVYMGDPAYGTLDTMEAFLYAENNFYDNNLDPSGSSTVTVYGNMTAGNQVAINRDWDNGDGTFTHSKLTVQFDDRLLTGAVTLPGLPDEIDESGSGFRITFWREAPVGGAGAALDVDVDVDVGY